MLPERTLAVLLSTPLLAYIRKKTKCFPVKKYNLLIYHCCSNSHCFKEDLYTVLW